MAATRERKPLLPVNPTVMLLEYHHATGFGLLLIDDTVYTLSRHTDKGKTVGVRLEYMSLSGEHIMHDIDLTANPPRCDCADHTFRPERPGGCRHLVALREAAATLRAAKVCGSNF
jgi:hypothetical protein